MKTLSDAEFFGQSSQQPLTDEEFLKAPAPAKVLSDEEFFGASEPAKTDLFSVEGAKSLGTAVVGAGKNIWQNAEDLITRPKPLDTEGFTGLTREQNLQIRALVDSGIPFQQAYTQVYGAAESLRNTEIMSHDTQMAAQRSAMQNELQDALPANPSEPLRHAQGVATSVATMAPAIAAGVATKSPAAALSIAAPLEMLPAYGESRDEGSGHERALVSSGLQAGVGTAFELSPIGGLIKDLGQEAFGKMLMKYVGRELMTEIPTTIVQEGIKQAIDTPDKPLGQFLEEMGASVVDTAIQTPFAAVLGGATAKGIDALLPQRTEPELPMENPIDGLETELATATTAGDKEGSEVLQNILNELNAEGDLTGRSLNQSTSQDLPDLPPDREALIQLPDPLADEELAVQVQAAQVQKVLPFGEANDGTSAVGVDQALSSDAQIGNTLKVRVNAENYEPNPNDAVPRSQRRIAYGPAEQVGQPLGKVKTKPATYVIGEPTADRSDDVLAGYHELYEKLRQDFMPDATIVLANETQSTRQAVGTTQKLASGEYLIIPAFVRNFSATEEGTLNAGSFNKHTKAKAFYNVYHEFGHALTMHRFLEGVAPEVQSAFTLEQRQGRISEEVIAGLNPEQAELAKEYNQLRAQMKTQSAEWFQQHWMSPAMAVQRQLVKAMGGYSGMNAESFVRRVVSNGNKDIATLRARMAVTRVPEERQAISQQIDELTNALVEDYLSFDEFMAEKMARYAHEKGLGRDTALGKGEYFSGGIKHVEAEEKVRQQLMGSTLEKVQNSLRKLFIALKKGLKLDNGQTWRISAGTSFEAWIQSLGKLSQLVAPQEFASSVSGEVKEALDKAKDTLPMTRDNYMAQKLRKAVTFGSFSVKQKQELYKLIRGNDLNTAHLRMVEMLKMRVRKQLDTDPQNGARTAGAEEAQQKEAIAAWVKHRERSPFFKAWFGDWENDPANASKVVTASGRPLVMFHGTKADIHTFNSGDIGAHFGDLLAAHARLYRSAPEEVHARIALDEFRGQRNAVGGDTMRPQDTGMNIIPVYLNIRNPLELSEVGAIHIWRTPVDLALHLQGLGVLSPVQVEAVQRNGEDFSTLKSILQHLGYDGIKYENDVEGGTSWVAFDSAQVKTANATFNSNDSRIHMQTDIDLTTATGLEIDTLSRTLEKYENMGLTGRALNWLARAQYSLLQLQQISWLHPEFYFLEQMANASSQYNAAKSRLQALGEGIAKDWQMLGKEADAKLNRALEKEADGGVHWTALQRDETGWKHVMTAETVDKLKEAGIDINTRQGKKAAEIYLRSKNALLQHTEAAQIVLARRLGVAVQEQSEFLVKLNELKKAFASIRETPFLPRGDYGEWGLVVYEQNGLERKVVYRQMFESNREWEKARELLEKNLKPGQRVRTIANLTDEKRALLALPREYVDVAAEALDMTQEQRDTLYDLLHPVKEDKLLAPYSKAIEKISGGSKDRMRNFADFIWHNSTLIARTEALASFNKAEQSARQMLAEVDKTPMRAGPRRRLLQDIKRAQKYMAITKDYMMAPPNEMYAARSFVAIVYLWGGIKTALLNLTGMVSTWGALTSKYGELAGDAAMLKANKQLGVLVSGKGKIAPEIAKMYERAITEGFLVQNYAAHLGAAATAGVTRRMTNRSRWAADTHRGLQWVADAGMAPFTMTEQYARRITFLATLNAAMAEAKKNNAGVNLESLYQEAVKQTDLLQNSYTLANRPKFMRGGGSLGGLLPLFTIFFSFAVHLAWHSTGGYNLGKQRRVEMLGAARDKGAINHTQRVLLVLLLLGGYEALPFSGNLLDILDAVLMSMTGKSARQHLREGIKQIPAPEGWHWVNDPRWWSKGMGGDVMGVDVSGSLGIGNPVPGTDIVNSHPETPEELAGRALLTSTGVTGSLIKNLGEMAINLGQGKSIEQNIQRFPGIVGSVSSGMEWIDSGEVKGRIGETIYEPSVAEGAAKIAGFTPSGLNKTREENWARTEAVMYWTKQRENLQAAWSQARDADDREALADVESRIEEFNDSVVDVKMRLQKWQLHKSYRAHLDAQRKRELGIVPKNARNLAAGVSESFADEEE
ncbi:PLxRFG domain-containing protein [Methylocaldum sp.]|uniref:PLxRFG domain-containing protein n=1 Tax=Methylocaldum sp. TaxID=1969727 RepID=UPI002D29B255|nr:PLxRFG domain-containing protein [Methylocaldum sp.]HYE38163.1 PLxRFG domain-containing protein [Methylocaldum sp.]